MSLASRIGRGDLDCTGDADLCVAEDWRRAATLMAASSA